MPITESLCFNRTFMELKFWTGESYGVKDESFNRTFMELKLTLYLTEIRMGSLF